MERSRKANQLVRIINTLIGILFCASAAALAAYFFHGSRISSMLPLVFLGVVVAVALRFGIAAGAIGSVASAIIFAVFLYRPAGSVAVIDTSARSSLGWLLLGGVVLSYLFAPHRDSRE